MMEDVRRRRMERKRQLQNRQAMSEQPPTVGQPLPKEQVTPVSDDPEYLWKYGGMNPWQSSASAPSQKPGFFTFMLRSFGIAAVLFLGISGLFRLEQPWAIKGQVWFERMMGQHLQFSAFSQWYAEHFSGSPSFIPSFSPDEPSATPTAAGIALSLQAPITGIVAQSYTPESRGVYVWPGEEQQVLAAATGQVAFAGESESDQLLVIIQHADKVQTIYGGLVRIAVEQGDRVEAGQQIGHSYAAEAPGYRPIYVAIRQNNQFIDPQEVMSFD